ncbi:MAG: hypothetical protein M3534_04795 [Actinomycetota bacterium]|nr:hypothetical protein [Actinomycetota bacterium]
MQGERGTGQSRNFAPADPRSGANGARDPTGTLDWRKAFARSAIVIAIYVGLFYFLGVAFPETFGLGDNAGITGLLINAVFFFFVFALVYAVVERHRRRSRALNNEVSIRRKLGTLPADRKTSVAVVAIAALLTLVVVLVVANPGAIWGPGYDVVYEKEMSWMMDTMSGYDYTDNEGMIYIKVEVEDPDSIDPAYEDLITHPKVTERDCVAVDFLVEGDRGGGIADERVIEGNQSCASDVEFFESRMGSLSEASRTNDLFGDELLKGERNPEGW